MIEAPPGPELYRRRQREQREVQPPHWDRWREAEHHRQASEQDERRERYRHQEVAAQLPVVTLVSALGFLFLLAHDTVTSVLYSLLQISCSGGGLADARQSLSPRPG